MWRPVIMTLAVVSVTMAFPTGAPDQQLICQSMAPNSGPQGHNAEPQPEKPFPYTVVCEQLNSTAIGMRVHGVGGVPTFRGIFAQLRDRSKMVGTFETFDNINYQTRCDKGGVTHRNNNDKTNAEFTIAVDPSDIQGDLECVVTIVKEKQEYWVQNGTPVKRPRGSGGSGDSSPRKSKSGGSKRRNKKGGKRGRRNKSRKSRGRKTKGKRPGRMARMKKRGGA